MTQWLLTSIPLLPRRADISDISITTHGAAFCVLNDDGLVLPPMDYEWDGYGEFRSQFQQRASVFDETGSPALPLGLNAGLQLAWLKHVKPQDWSSVRHVLPYAQYWAWWFCAHMASEVSSLGCHTHLWSPHEHSHSSWAGVPHPPFVMRADRLQGKQARSGETNRLSPSTMCHRHCVRHWRLCMQPKPRYTSSVT